MRVIITAGGTGGHIYPALAIINKIKEKEPNSKFLYIGTHNRMEKDIIPNEKIEYLPIEIYGFSSKLILRDIKNIFLIKKAYKKCLEVIKSFKPDIVIGAGGYVTYPVIKAAHKLKVKTFIHEQNSIPGKSNKTLAKYASAIGISFEESKEHFKNANVIWTGNPCSDNALNLKPMKKESFGLTKNKKLVVIVAGSLGSESLNTKMRELLFKVKNASYEILYITGKSYYNEFIDKTKFPDNVKVVPYVDNLSRLFKVTDLIVTRAGASVMSEIIALQIPSIFIPSPYVPNNHQYYNALKITESEAGYLIEEKDLSAILLKEKMDFILNNKEEYIRMKNNLSKLKIENSSEKIYDVIKDLIK